MLRIFLFCVAGWIIAAFLYMQFGDNPQMQSFAAFKGAEKAKKSANKTSQSGDFTTIEWIELMPKDDLDALLNPPSYIADIVDGSAEDQILKQPETTSNDRYQQALVSKRIVPDMDGRAIRIPGFIVPVEFNDEQAVTQFFLVPYFGACLHMPPPPPNQILFVEYPEGLELESIYDPFWISGVVNVALMENDLATAAYSVKMEHIEKYTD